MKLTKADIEKLANDIIDFLDVTEMLEDVSIFYNNRKINFRSSWDRKTGTLCLDKSETEDVSPFEYFEYANPDHILSMTFEGPFYEAINYSGYKMEQFSALLKQYGLYYELGNAWNLSLFPINDDMEIEFTPYKRKPDPEHIWYGCDHAPEALKTVMEVWFELSKAKGDIGSCVIGAGFNLSYNEKEYFMSSCSPWQGSLSWESNVDVVKKLLKEIGATDIHYDYGCMD